VRPYLLKKSKKKNLSQKRAGGVAQGVGPEFKTPVLQNKKTKKDGGVVYMLARLQVQIPVPHTTSLLPKRILT
jgi:hypothetical protein